jgi:hypothetical protein
LSVTYRIQDEPVGGRSRIPALDPFWPFIAMMFGGAWLGAAAFSVNAWILRGPTWGREIGLAIAILIGAPVIFAGLLALGVAGVLPDAAFKYAGLLIVAWKLALAYWIFFRQQSSYALYEYFGGAVNQAQALPIGMLLVFVGGYLKSAVMTVFDSPYWRIMVS